MQSFPRSGTTSSSDRTSRSAFWGCCCSSARDHLDRQGTTTAGKTLDPAPPAGVCGRRARSVPLLVAGQEGHPAAARLCRNIRGSARLSMGSAAQAAAARRSRISAEPSPATDGACAAASRCCPSRCRGRVIDTPNSRVDRSLGIADSRASRALEHQADDRAVPSRIWATQFSATNG